MLTRLTAYEQQALAHDLRGWTTGGNPYAVLASHKLPAVPRRRIRVVRDGWYGVDRKPVEVGQVLALPADEARGAVGLGRAEFV
jgi:hypothetical protein